jgi:tetratricopeptide (TPR) repeat protein
MPAAFFRRVPLALWVFVGAFLVQFLLLNRMADSRFFLPDGEDMKFYNEWALKIHGDLPWQAGDVNAPGQAFYGMPGYAYALAGAYGVTGYDETFSPYLMGQIQALFHAGTAMFLFLLGRRVFAGSGEAGHRRGTVIGLLAAAGWVAFTPAQVFSAILMPLAFVVCAFWGLVYWLVCVGQRDRTSWWRPWVGMGLLAGVTAMLVASILMLLPLVVVAIVLTVERGRAVQRRLPAMLGAVAVLFAGVFAGCSPVWYYNYFVAHDAVLLSSHDGLNYFLGNHEGANGYTHIPAGLRASQEGLTRDSLEIPERFAGHVLKRSEASAFWKKRAQDYKDAHFGEWLRLRWVKIANFWNTYQYDDLAILKLMRDEGGLPPGLRFGLAAALGLPGLVLCAWRWPRSRWVAGAIVMLLLALLPVFVTERYRLAAAPGLLLLGAGGLYFCWESLCRKALVPVVLYGGLLAGATAFVTRTNVPETFWSLDYYKAGILQTQAAGQAMTRAEEAGAAAAKLRATGHPAEAGMHEEQARQFQAAVPAYLGRAQKSLETAYAYEPTGAAIVFELGNVWFRREKFDAARACYLRALELSPPGQPVEGALNNLGVIAMAQQHWDEAERRLTEALKHAPRDAGTWATLAAARKGKGDVVGARQAIGEAIKREPGNAGFRAMAGELK